MKVLILGARELNIYRIEGDVHFDYSLDHILNRSLEVVDYVAAILFTAVKELLLVLFEHAFYTKRSQDFLFLIKVVIAVLQIG